MDVFNQTEDDVDCSTDGCDALATHWVAKGSKAWPVCEKCRDELTSEPNNYRELRVV